jgi:hypothetical protein
MSSWLCRSEAFPMFREGSARDLLVVASSFSFGVARLRFKFNLKCHCKKDLHLAAFYRSDCHGSHGHTM